MEKLLLSPEQAGELLGVGRSTVYDLIRMRVIPSVKVGRCRKIPTSALRVYVEQLTEQAS